MTDNEIKQALPFLAKYCKDEYNDIRVDEVLLGAFDIINRQQAEIENMNNLVVYNATCATKLQLKLVEAKAEAIKEFAKRLKEKAEYFWEEKESFVSETDIDNLVKEMVGDTE